MGFPEKQKKVVFGQFSFDPHNGEIFSGTSRRVLTPKDCQVLCCLLERPLHIVNKDDIFAKVWPDTNVSEGVLRACIKRIRRLLGDKYAEPVYIETVQGRGYRFLCRVQHTGEENHPGHGDMAALVRDSITGSRAIPQDRYTHAIVGREKEMLLLLDGKAKAATGAVVALFISGKAGIGKTALVQTFITAVGNEKSSILLHGQCNRIAEAREPCFPVLDALEGLMEAYGSHDFKALLRTYAPMWLLHFPWLMTDEEKTVLAGQLQGVSVTRMVREFSVLLETVSREIPVTLIIEDLHWADEQTISILINIMQKGDKARILLVGTFRPQYSRTVPFSGLFSVLLAQPDCSHQRLSPLCETNIRHYLLQSNASYRDVDGLASWLYKNTEGLPLFMHHLYSHALAEGWLMSNCSDLFYNRKIPQNLRDLINCRIEKLSQLEQQFLEFVSVFGMSFNTHYLDSEDTGLTLSVEQCAEKLTRGYEFLHRSGDKAYPGGSIGAVYSFSHSWFQKVAYERLAPQKRAYYHHRIGLKLEQLFQDRVTEVAPAVALHFEKGGDISKAVHYRNIAGQVAFSKFSTDEALRHFNRGLKLFNSLSEFEKQDLDELDMLVPLGSTLVATKGYAHPEVERIYQRAHSLCLEAEKRPQLLPTLYGLCNYYMVRGEFEPCLELLKIFIDLATNSESRDALLWGYSVACMVKWYQGDYRGSCKFASCGLEHYNPASQRKNSFLFGMDAGLVCMMHNALAQWIMGYPQRGRKEMDRALEIAAEYGTPFMYAFALCFSAWLQSFLRNYASSNSYARSSLQLAAEHGIEYWNIQASILWEWSNMMENGKGATAVLQGYINAHRAAGARLIHGKFLFLLAECHAQKGDFSKALSCLDDGLQVTENCGEDWWKAEFFRLKGDLLLKSGRNNRVGREENFAEVENFYLQAINIARDQSAKSLELRAAMSLCSLNVFSEKSEETKKVLGNVYQTFTEGFDTHDLQRARQLLNS